VKAYKCFVNAKQSKGTFNKNASHTVSVSECNGFLNEVRYEWEFEFTKQVKELVATVLYIVGGLFLLLIGVFASELVDERKRLLARRWHS